ncbi:MAG: hypothetical protein BGO49_28600 [Planctomycetales bacterium 71-10]|nr:MAG: hypothetical protein BGO49_28600 [Planctomycetales bacterium 71-10]
MQRESDFIAASSPARHSDAVGRLPARKARSNRSRIEASSIAAGGTWGGGFRRADAVSRL